MKVRIIKEACGAQPAEPIHQPHVDHGEGKMARGQLYNIVQYATELMQMFDDQTDLPEWVEAKITKAFSYLDDAAHYLQASNARDQGLFDVDQLRAMVMEELEAVREGTMDDKPEGWYQKKAKATFKEGEKGYWDNVRAKAERCKGKPETGDCAPDPASPEELKNINEEELEEKKKKKPCKKAKGKKFVKRVNGRCRSYGQAGKAKGGGPRIRPGTKKADAYCARSAKIKKCKEPPCANTLSRKKWKCKGSKSKRTEE